MINFRPHAHVLTSGREARLTTLNKFREFLFQGARAGCLGATHLRNTSFKVVLLSVIMAGGFSMQGIAQENGQYGSTSDYTSEHPLATPICLAKYVGGNWDYGTHFDPNGKIDGGGLHHLITSLCDWSHDRIRLAVWWIDVDSPNLPSVPPPFIVFTGTKDFSLTDQEIKNLRSYLKLGGKIWGDNARGGLGSSFDVAFRREMKRVMVDPKKNFEMIGPTDVIFTKSWFDLTNSLTGTNSVEHLDVDGVTAIIYTSNNVLDNSASKEQLGMNIIGQGLVRY